MNESVMKNRLLDFFIFLFLFFGPKEKELSLTHVNLSNFDFIASGLKHLAFNMTQLIIFM